MKLKDLFTYIAFLHKFNTVERTVKTSGKNGLESDAEHSYQLALVAWYITEKLNLNLDRPLLLEYALVHDLVEIYAGDTDPHKHLKEFIGSKDERERRALKKIEKKFPDFKSLHNTLQKYEELNDRESRFVYLVDKILPVMNTYLAHDSYYSVNNVSYEKWKAWLETKRVKANFDDPAFDELLNKLADFLSKIEKGFFG